MLGRHRTSLDSHTAIVLTILGGDKSPRDLFAKIDSQETARQLDSVKFVLQCFNNLFPITVSRERAPRRTTNAMFAVELHVERIKGVAAGRDGDADAVVEGALVARHVEVRRFVLRLVELKANLGEIVELRDGIASNLGLDAAFKDGVEERVDVRLFCKVDEGPGVCSGLDYERTTLVSQTGLNR